MVTKLTKPPEQQVPQAGEWWIHIAAKTSNTCSPSWIYYIVGTTPTGKIVTMDCCGDLLIDEDWNDFYHEPECTGLDWQPNPVLHKVNLIIHRSGKVKALYTNEDYDKAWWTPIIIKDNKFYVPKPPEPEVEEEEWHE